MNLREQLIKHEGVRLKPYKDSLGILTIGCGRNLDDVGISYDEALVLLDHDIDNARAGLAKAFPWTNDLDPVRRDALTNMAFNMGIGRLRGFMKMLDALKIGDWQEASSNALESRWAVQVGNRARELAKQLLTGEYA